MGMFLDTILTSESTNSVLYNQEVTDEYLNEEFGDLMDSYFGDGVSEYEPTLEGAQAVAVYMEDSWNDLQQDYDLQQLKYYVENGTQMPVDEEYIGILNEGKFDGLKEKAGNIKTKVVGWLNKVWAKIKQLFAKFFGMLTAWVGSDKQFVKKYKSLIKDKKAPTDYQGYNFTITSSNDVNFADSKLSGYHFKSTLSIDNENFNKGDIMEEMRGKVFGEGPLSKSEFSKKCFATFRNGKAKGEKENVKCNLTELLSHVETAAQDKKDANKAYKTIKKTIEDNIKAINQSRMDSGREALKGETTPKAAMSAQKGFSNAIAQMKGAISVLNQYNGAYLTAIKDRNRQARAIIAKVVYGKAKEEANDEAAELYRQGAASIFI